MKDELRLQSKAAPRALFYSHDTLGLGHLRRTLLIAEGLQQRIPDLSILIVTGSAMAHGFRLRRQIDYVKIPSVIKVDDGVYRSRTLSLSFSDLVKMRSDLILQSVVDFKPDLLFVDNVPNGMGGEILPALEHMRQRHDESRTCLILRDILDDPAKVLANWKVGAIEELLDVYYDRILICGLPAIFDASREYRFSPSIRKKTRYCGYIPRKSAFPEEVQQVRREVCSNGEKLILVTVGGGSDGEHLVGKYLEALPEISDRIPVASTLLLGPEMPPQRARYFRARFGQDPHITFIDFTSNPMAHMGAADAIVSMAGYNTISEILWLGKRALVVPRIHPRTEQLIRSRKLEQLGLLHMIHPQQISPTQFADRLIHTLEAPPPPTLSGLFDFTAIEVIVNEVEQVTMLHLPMARGQQSASRPDSEQQESST